MAVKNDGETFWGKRFLFALLLVFPLCFLCFFFRKRKGYWLKILGEGFWIGDSEIFELCDFSICQISSHQKEKKVIYYVSKSQLFESLCISILHADVFFRIVHSFDYCYYLFDYFVFLFVLFTRLKCYFTRDMDLDHFLFFSYFCCFCGSKSPSTEFSVAVRSRDDKNEGRHELQLLLLFFIV